MDTEEGTLATPVKNFPLLWKVYDHIVAHPEEWDQAAWAIRVRDEDTETTALLKDGFCGTSFCVAGHAVHMSDPSAEFIFEVWKGSDFVCANKLSLPGGTTEWVGTHAAKMLGLDEDEAELLFNGANSLPSIHDLLRRWEKEDTGV